MKKSEKQVRVRLQRHQSGSMLFLCGALMYYIVAQGAMIHTEYFPTTIFAPVALHTQTIEISKADDLFPTEVGEMSLGTELNDQQRIDKMTKHFSSKTETIYLSVELINPNKGAEIQGFFYYYERKNSEPVLLSSSSVILADRSQDIVFFSLPRPGSQWQLRGAFKAIILIPSSGIKEDIDFTIY